MRTTSIGALARDLVVVVVLTATTMLTARGLFFGDVGARKYHLAVFGDVTALHRALWLWTAAAVVITAGFLLSSRQPMAALALVGVGGVAHLLDPRIGVQPLDLLVPWVLFRFADHTRTRRSTAVVSAVFLGGTILAELVNTLSPSDKLAASAIAEKGSGPALLAATSASIPILAVLAFAAAAGDGARSRRQTLAGWRRQAEDLLRDRELRESLAAAEERARISRELHDVVAHGLSVIVAQAQGGAAALDRRPDRAAAALQHVIATGRSSLAEMRRLLREPPPSGLGEGGLAGVPELVGRVRSAGLPVRFSEGGQPVPVSFEVDRTAYRVVQEALTNVLRHAGPDASAEVSVTYLADALDIVVRDDGLGGSLTHPDGRGRGLRGMAERVSVLEGRLSTGPSPWGGFEVSAHLPIRPM